MAKISWKKELQDFKVHAYKAIALALFSFIIGIITSSFYFVKEQKKQGEQLTEVLYEFKEISNNFTDNTMFKNQLDTVTVITVQTSKEVKEIHKDVEQINRDVNRLFELID